MNWVAMFPGQGSQKAGMGEELLNLYPDLLIDEFEETLGWSLKQTILQSEQSEITKTNIAQPYIFAISYCYGLEAFKKLGQPKIGIGHSLGEYTALALSEFISYSDALKIISVRGDSMQKAVENSNSTMAAVLTSDLKQTIDFAKQVDADYYSLSVLAPYYGTELYDQLMKNGHELDQQPWEYFFHQSPKPMVNDKLSTKVLQEYLSLAELNKKTKKKRGYV